MVNVSRWVLRAISLTPRWVSSAAICRVTTERATPSCSAAAAKLPRSAIRTNLSFDPERPESAKATVDVDLASIDTGSAESDQEVAGKVWFNTPAFPTARFTTSSVKALGDHRYEAAGQLTIKGKTQDVVIPATFAVQGKAGVFEGRFTLHRGDFAIGEGPWAKFDVVANEVQIQFRITAQAGE